MGPFPASNGHRYILVAVDYVSKWAEAVALHTNDAKVVMSFVKIRFGTPGALISDEEKTKRWHDKHILHREFESGQAVLLFNSRLKLFRGKLKSRWSDPFEVGRVTKHGAIKLKDLESNDTFLVNGKRVKHYWGGGIRHHKTSIDLVDA
ncbi:uncharacterized protein LOC107814251 [Nicotiana tabacum]|uniref:Uncharacterized protein LOC107814251 n=1 Tax=Nicotiana tabacum TaxID=4097 RepID=A0AC58SRJ5_TOBAC